MKSVLVGIDGSERSLDVLAAAIAETQAHGGKLFLVRAVGLPPELPQDFWKTTDEPLLDVLVRHGKADLDRHAASVPAAVLGGAEVSVGTPWQAICDTARRLEADLIVIGSHGYAGLDRLLGTTAAKVVNHAGCSVLVVRGPHSGVAR